uniref:hypothetical protein n=1 Tax=Escherichia coli TaxID=562 RepID=UPI0013D128AD
TSVASAEAPEVDDGKAFAADLAEDLAGVAPLAPSADTGEEAPAESINSLAARLDAAGQPVRRTLVLAT